jgi:hypothetical protein
VAWVSLSIFRALNIALRANINRCYTSSQKGNSGAKFVPQSNFKRDQEKVTRMSFIIIVVEPETQQESQGVGCGENNEKEKENEICPENIDRIVCRR